MTTKLTPDQSRLVSKYIGLARSYVFKYLGRYPWHRHLRDDLEQEALLGLCKAAQNWKPGRAKFITYASWVIASHVGEAQRKLSNPVSAPTSSGSSGESKWRPAVRVRRGPMPLVEPSARPDIEDTIDASKVFGLAYAALEPQVGARDADLFLRTEFFETEQGYRGPCARIAKEFGISRERGRVIRNQTREKFHEWVERMREEAA